MNNDAFFYPQKMGRIILLGMEEVVGKSGLNAVLRLAKFDDLIENYPRSSAERTFPFETVSLLPQTLEQVYGPRGGRGLALRSGRACFKYGLKEYGSMLGITEMAFRLLPLPTKIRVGAKSFADLFNRHTDQKVRLEETETKILWHIERCPLCWERTEQEPVCHLAVGLLQEALYWVSGGKVFNVVETACAAKGDPVCTITIDKTPLS
ncbi:MAG TPA: 4-vinyl reductase [Anaerolineales bacterium]|jgi:predicted hydrocarbon binding protein|nr:4-vinyl reductase [Anaerolineae bacterium]HRJ55599.1 4-vinyl reductase [Anaerolineales bacterium]HRK89427.1 4-vinyl reductase [Anaerolineales bacterium]